MAQMQILLSTWNGASWLEELLESLVQQSVSDWELLIRDDGSKDNTLKLLTEWREQHPHKVAQFEAGLHIGCTASFSRLVEWSTAPYLMFCDQDDIWFPEKIEWSLAALQNMEVVHGMELPLLVHADMAVVEQDKHLIAPSFWALRDFDLEQGKEAYLLTNVVSGCASLFNRKAAELAFPAPLEAMQHDRWLALVCAWFGKIEPLAQPLLWYRQHGLNALGAKQASWSTHHTVERVNAWSRQAEAFLQSYGAQLTHNDYETVAALANLQYVRGWERRWQIIKHRFFKSGVAANLALMLFA